MKSSAYYFHVKTKILADFQIRIIVPLNLFQANIASLDKDLDDLHNLLSIVKLQIQVTGKCEHKIKKGSCLNGSLPGYNFEFEPTTSTQGGVRFFINDNLCNKVRNN